MRTTAAHSLSLAVLLPLLLVATVRGFSRPCPLPQTATSRLASSSSSPLPQVTWRKPACIQLSSKASPSADDDDSTPSQGSDALVYRPLFDFSDAKLNATDKFERIDDAIMGGISQSSLRQSSENYATWSGVCRTDGGGFCGTRTLPFRQPVNVEGASGFYLTCRLTSDDDVDKRVWKMTTRSDQTRGEMLYQAAYEMPSNDDQENGDGWKTIKIPFEDFQLVSGPKMVPDGKPLNTTGGIYQIGLALSKFQISDKTSELPSFRPGYFEVQVREIGLFWNSAAPGGADAKASQDAVNTPDTLSKKESLQKRPMPLKLLLPLARIFVNEQSQRRKSAMRILKKRGLSRFGAICFAVKNRARSQGLVPAVFRALRIAFRDCATAVVAFCLKLILVYPFVAIRRFLRLFSNKPKPANE